jgi:hypothetical protein
MTVADDNSMQDQVAEYDGEGKERAARDGGRLQSGDDGCGSGRWLRRTTTAMVDDKTAADDKGGGRQRHAIRRHTMGEREESGWQTTTALGKG